MKIKRRATKIRTITISNNKNMKNNKYSKNNNYYYNKTTKLRRLRGMTTPKEIKTKQEIR